MNIGQNVCGIIVKSEVMLDELERTRTPLEYQIHHMKESMRRLNRNRVTLEDYD